MERTVKKSQELAELDGAADRVTIGISRMILEGEIGPGGRLKLSELAERFDVGLMPVREALWKLEGSGLIANIPNRGAVVREISDAEIANVYEVRGAIEAALIERAVALVTSSDIEAIDAARVAFEDAARSGDPRALLLTDTAFHSTINDIARNDVATGILRRSLLLIRSLRLQVGFDPTRVAQIVREHAGIAAAIREGDAPLAVRRAHMHTNGARRSLLESRSARGVGAGHARNVGTEGLSLRKGSGRRPAASERT